MKAQEIYNLAINKGIEADLRGKKSVEKNLVRLKERYKKFSEEEKEDFDLESLKNPYSDTRIHFDTGKDVKKILAGIEGIEFIYLTEKDVVRHKLVQDIIKAYDRYEADREKSSKV